MCQNTNHHQCLSPRQFSEQRDFFRPQDGSISHCFMLSTALSKHRGSKQRGEERVYLAFSSRSQSVTEGSQGRNSGKTWSRNRVGMVLPGSLPLTCAQADFLYNPEPPPQGRHCWPSTSIGNQENTAKSWPQATLKEGGCRLGLPQVALDGVKLTGEVIKQTT